MGSIQGREELSSNNINVPIINSDSKIYSSSSETSTIQNVSKDDNETSEPTQRKGILIKNPKSNDNNNERFSIKSGSKNKSINNNSKNKVIKIDSNTISRNLESDKKVNFSELKKSKAESKIRHDLMRIYDILPKKARYGFLCSYINFCLKKKFIKFMHERMNRNIKKILNKDKFVTEFSINYKETLRSALASFRKDIENIFNDIIPLNEKIMTRNIYDFNDVKEMVARYYGIFFTNNDINFNNDYNEYVKSKKTFKGVMEVNLVKGKTLNRRKLNKVLTSHFRINKQQSKSTILNNLRQEESPQKDSDKYKNEIISVGKEENSNIDEQKEEKRDSQITDNEAHQLSHNSSLKFSFFSKKTHNLKDNSKLFKKLSSTFIAFSQPSSLSSNDVKKDTDLEQDIKNMFNIVLDTNTINYKYEFEHMNPDFQSFLLRIIAEEKEYETNIFLTGEFKNLVKVFYHIHLLKMNDFIKSTDKYIITFDSNRIRKTQEKYNLNYIFTDVRGYKNQNKIDMIKQIFNEYKGADSSDGSEIESIISNKNNNIGLNDIPETEINLKSSESNENECYDESPNLVRGNNRMSELNLNSDNCYYNYFNSKRKVASRTEKISKDYFKNREKRKLLFTAGNVETQYSTNPNEYIAEKISKKSKKNEFEPYEKLMVKNTTEESSKKSAPKSNLKKLSKIKDFSIPTEQQIMKDDEDFDPIEDNLKDEIIQDNQIKLKKHESKNFMSEIIKLTEYQNLKSIKFRNKAQEGLTEKQRRAVFKPLKSMKSNKNIRFSEILDSFQVNKNFIIRKPTEYSFLNNFFPLYHKEYYRGEYDSVTLSYAGFGEHEFPDVKQFYKGTFRSGIREGLGILYEISPDDSIVFYGGEFIDGNFGGVGLLLNLKKDQLIFEKGNFEDNKFTSGLYISIEKNGNSIAASKYEGDLDNGLFEGYGKLVKKIYENSEDKGYELMKDEEYNGHFSKGKKNGNGIIRTKLVDESENYVYTGNFNNDIKEGYGHIFFYNQNSNIKEYEGFFHKNKKFYKFGRVVFRSGDVYHGFFSKGLKSKVGLYIYSPKNGIVRDIFFGWFMNDWKHGLGKYMSFVDYESLKIQTLKGDLKMMFGIYNHGAKNGKYLIIVNSYEENQQQEKEIYESDIKIKDDIILKTETESIDSNFNNSSDKSINAIEVIKKKQKYYLYFIANELVGRSEDVTGLLDVNEFFLKKNSQSISDN